jgi:transposase
VIVIGVDAHKRLHVAVALDDRGPVLEEWKGANSPAGWSTFFDWCRALGPERQVGIEGAWNMGLCWHRSSWSEERASSR